MDASSSPEASAEVWERLRQSELLHRTLTANLPDTSVFLLDRDLRILIAEGEGVRRLAWIDEEMFRGRTVCELQGELPSEVLALSLECYQGALAGERRAFEFTSDGLTYEVTAVPVRGQDDEVKSAMAVVRDVTDRRAVEADRARLAAIVADSAMVQAERVASESQERLQSLLDHAPTPMRLRDLEGRYLVINRSCAELIGSTVEEALCRDPLAPYPSHIADYLDEQERRVRAGDGASTIEVSADDSAGQRHAYLATKFPVTDGDGRTVAVGGIWLDVTERKQAEQALRDVEERYRDMFESSPAGIIETTLEGVPLAVNEAWASIFGYDSPEQFLAAVANTDELYTEATDRKVMAQEVRNHGAVKGIELRMRRRDATTVWVAIHGRSLTHPDSGVVRWQASAVDITERKRVEEALRESEERFRLLAENSRDVIRLYDAEAMIRYASPSCATVLGFAVEELLGHHSSEFQHPDDAASRKGREQSVIAAEDEVTVTYRSCHKDGGYVWLESSVRALRDEKNGQILGFQEAARDVSDRKHAEAEIHRANEEAQQANRAKSEFLAGMSHELRTPLNAILGFTGTLLMGLSGPLNDEQTTHLRTVQRGGRHLLSLINDLLDLAQIESGKVELHPEAFDCHALLDEVAIGLRPLADENGLELEVAPVPARIQLFCDRRAVSQILINLTNNAIKFTDHGSVRLEISQHIDQERSLTRFAVIDTGPGIAPVDQARLFTAFEQIAGPHARSIEGTGLGLHISQALAGLLDGSITFQSATGEGSTFALEITAPAT